MSATFQFGDKVQRDRYGRYKIPFADVMFPSSTTVCGQVDKPALRFWYSKQAANHMRTLVLEKLTNKEATLEDLRSMNIDALMKEAKERPSILAEEAADIGTRVHESIDEYNKTGENREHPITDDIRNPFDAYLKWMKEYDVQPLGSEITVWSMERKFAGTLDMPCKLKAPAWTEHRLYVNDHKTAGNIYPEHLMQLASYVYAYEERTGTVMDGGSILLLDKQTGFPMWHGFSKEELAVPLEKFFLLLNYWHLGHAK